MGRGEKGETVLRPSHPNILLPIGEKGLGVVAHLITREKNNGGSDGPRDNDGHDNDEDYGAVDGDNGMMKVMMRVVMRVIMSTVWMRRRRMKVMMVTTGIMLMNGRSEMLSVRDLFSLTSCHCFLGLLLLGKTNGYSRVVPEHFQGSWLNTVSIPSQTL